MKKRLLSMLLALSMLIGMIPTSVLAAGAPSVKVDGKDAIVEERYNEDRTYYVLMCPQGKDVSLTMEVGGIYMGEFAVEGAGELTISADQLMQCSLPAEVFNDYGYLYNTVAEGNSGVELIVVDYMTGEEYILYVELTPADEPACDHSDAAAKTNYEQVSGTEFHTVTVTCKCGEVQFGEVTTDSCVDDDADGKCDLCKGNVAVYDKEINLKISDVVVSAGTTEIVVPLQVKYNIASLAKNGSYWKFIVTYDESKLELTDDSYVRPTAHTAFSLSDPGRTSVTAEKGTGCYMYKFGVSAKRNSAYKTDFIDFGNLTFKIKDPSAESVYTIGIQEGGLLLNKTDTAYVTGSPNQLAYKPGTITIEAAAACEHTETTTTYAQVEGTETHSITVTCKCGEVISTTTEACVDANSNLKCDVCEGTVACKHPTSELVWAQVSPGIEHVSYNKCTVCGAHTSDEIHGNCADNNGDGKCDECGFEVAGCAHEETKRTYEKIEGTNTHYVVYNCEMCFNEVDREIVDCVDTKNGADGICDKCKEPMIADSCQHTETTTTNEQVSGTETHTITVTCNACGEQIGEVTTAACEDTDGDLKCDVCEGAVACKHPTSELVWAQVSPGVEHVSYEKCTVCGAHTSEEIHGYCADNDGDGKCDECGYAVAGCAHPEKPKKTYEKIEGTNTHYTVQTCKDCGSEIGREVEDCVDEKNNNDKNDKTPDGLCDKCKGEMIADSCQHTETTTTNEQVSGTETHTITVTCNACGEVTSTTTESCEDTDGDLKCDVCEGTVACKHPVTTKNYVQVEGEEKHTVTEICVHPKCTKTLSETTEACVDTDANGKCDLCGGSVAVSAVSVWDGTVPTSMTLETTTTADGKNAYVIRNAAEFAYWASKNHASGSKGDTWRTYTVLLETDIDLAGHKWSPPRAGKTGKNSIVFDGQGHTIKGLYINQSTKKTGLFGVVDGGIKNLTVIGEVTNTEDYTGGIVGQIGGFIENCAFYGTVNGDNYVGGIAGGAQEGASFTNCANIATVTGSGNGVGGVVGVVENVPVWNCYNAGDVSASKYVGGIVGYANGENDGATIMNCYNVGGVTMTLYSETLGNNSDAGAIAGTGKHTVENCYYLNVGVISGSQTNMAGTMKTEAELKSMVGALNAISAETYDLGEVWAADNFGLNNGYPIFAWQAPNVEEIITLTAPSATASANNKTVTVTVPASEQDVNAQIQYRMGTIVLNGDREDYSWDNWQLDNKFYGLDAGTYVFQARYIGSDIFAYVDSEPSDAVEVVVNEVDGVSPPAPVLTPEMVKTSTDGSTVTLDWSEYDNWWPEEFGPEAVAAQFRIGIANEDGSIIWNEWSNTVTQNGSDMQYVFSGLTRNTQYAIQARFVGFDFAVDSPLSAPLNLPASGMMKINFRLMGLTQPNTVGDVNTSALNRGGIDLKAQLEAARNGKVVDGYDGAVYRNLLQTAEYEVPAAINVSSFIGYPLAQNNLDFSLGVPTSTVIEVPELFWDDANDGHYINPNNWYYGTGTGWVALVIRDGKVVSECKPYGATFVLQDGDSVVLCCVADTGYELKTNPTSPNFTSHAIATGLTDLIHKFLEFPDLSHEEYVPVLALEKQIEALKNNVDDKDITAAEEAYAALSADQKTAVKHYEKLVAARETYDNQQLGDLNGDKSKDQKDVTLMIRFLAEMDMENEEGFTIKYADLNKDSKIDLLDLIILRRHLASGNGSWMDYQTLPYVPKK